MNYKDINFFQPGFEREKIAKKKRIPFIVIGTCLAIILLYVIFLELSERKLSKEYDALDTELINVEAQVVVSQSQLEEVSGDLQKLQTAKNDLESENSIAIQGGKSITDEQLKAILNSTPKESFYSSIVIQEGVVVLQGYAETTQVVAKIVYNLEQTGKVGDVLLSNVMRDGDNYTFTITTNLKE